MRLPVILLTFFSLISLSYAGNINLEHKVLGGKWHKSGDLVISHQDVRVLE